MEALFFDAERSPGPADFEAAGELAVAGWLLWLQAAPEPTIAVVIATARTVIAIRKNFDMVLNEVPTTDLTGQLFRISKRRFARPQLPHCKIVERCCTKATYP